MGRLTEMDRPALAVRRDCACKANASWAVMESASLSRQPLIMDYSTFIMDSCSERSRVCPSLHSCTRPALVGQCMALFRMLVLRRLTRTQCRIAEVSTLFFQHSAGHQRPGAR